MMGWLLLFSLLAFLLGGIVRGALRDGAPAWALALLIIASTILGLSMALWIAMEIEL